ncbi:uncharacterized protein LOC128732986 [Sabethes cyaneus]|uniref:uncharacterized protein LOC128732986 n=1 Tax=Sabethes cyaneus TaxID=53552 RepID=UPI00237E3405|nr:uncharacterized protein LOC128732986 [Sabethes cyaneus]
MSHPEQGNPAAAVEPEATCLVMEETRRSKRTERKQLQVSISKSFQQALDADDLEQFQSVLNDPRIEILNNLIEEMKYWDAQTTIPEPKTFLFNSKLQLILDSMLQETNKYQPYLERFISRFNCVNERISGPDLNAPLHYAVEQLNVKFIEWLLDQPNIQVNCRNKQRKTALFLLCELYDALVNSPKFKKRSLKAAENRPQVEDLRQIILMLIKAKADFNICSDRLQLPFELLMRNTSKENAGFLEECVKQFNGAIVIGKRKKQMVHFYQNAVPDRVTIELLEIYLRFEEEGNFAQQLEWLNIHTEDVSSIIRCLLHTAVELNLERSVRKIVEYAGKKIFQVEKLPKKIRTRVFIPADDEEVKGSKLLHRVELKGLLKKACENGNVNILGVLLNNMTDKILINDEPILALTLNRAHELQNRYEERARVLQCADLLSKDQKIHLTRTDNNGNTALHNALKFGFTDIALELLQQKYAFLGIRNKDGLTPLHYARYDFWKMYFDQCVSIDVKRSYYDRNEIRFNLNGFDPYIFKKRQVKSNAPRDRNKQNLWRIVEKASVSNTLQKPEPTFVTEMDPIKIIAKSKDLKPLLIHPVIYSFILVKWLRLTKWSYLNLFCTLLTVVCFSLHSLDACNGGDYSILLTCLTLIGAIYMIFREIVQAMFLGLNYLSSMENYLDIGTITSMLIVLSGGCNSILSSLTIIAFAMQLTVLIGSLPFNSLSTYMYMFKTVSVNFLKSFLLFIPLLAAFTFGFFVSYNDQTTTQPITSNGTEEDFNKFTSFSNAALKTLVMTTGEFEAAAVDFSGGKIILFVLFIFFAPIVILNLINGLAVSDITAIKQESELISISKKVLILERYERGLRSLPINYIRKLFPSPFFENHSYVIAVRPKEFRKIVVQQIANLEGGCKKLPKGEWRVVPNLPGAWFARGTEGFYVNLKLLKFPLFLTLDEHVLDEALRIADQSIIVKEIVDSRRFEIESAAAATNEVLEMEVKFEELKMEMEKINRILNRLVVGKSRLKKKSRQTTESEAGDMNLEEIVQSRSSLARLPVSKAVFAHKTLMRKNVKVKAGSKSDLLKTVNVVSAVKKFEKKSNR